MQSTALLVCSCLGLHGVPKADVAIFADTQGEPSWVYQHYLTLRLWSEAHGIPVNLVTAGDLAQDTIDRHRGKRSRVANIPAFVDNNGEAGILRRHCSREYKVEPIEREVRRFLGYKPRQRVKKRVRALVGISTDEASRMRPNDKPWITNVYPLVDAGIGRQRCEAIIRQAGVAVPWKSACYFCPYHSNGYWQSMKDNFPKEFARAVEFDAAIRDMSASGVKGRVYLHRSLKPLDEVVFTQDDGQLAMWDEECDGICGT